MNIEECPNGRLPHDECQECFVQAIIDRRSYTMIKGDCFCTYASFPPDRRHYIWRCPEHSRATT